MKNIQKALLLISVLAFAGCAKDARLENKLEGYWELRHVKGGQIAGISPDYQAGNGKVYKFDGKTYQALYKDSVIASGTYTIVTDKKEIDGTNFTHKLDFEGRTLDLYAKISGKTLLLSLGSMAHDGVTETYVKL